MMTAIREIEVIHISLPTRREHKWTGLTEPIGGYILIRMTGDCRHATAAERADVAPLEGLEQGRINGIVRGILSLPALRSENK